MKTRFLLAAFLLSSQLFAGEIALKGKVTAVTVYTSGAARVTRTAPVQIPAGRVVLRSTALPVKADPSSIQVALPGARIESVETRRELVDESKLEGKRAEHRKKLETQRDRIFAVEQKLNAITDETRTLNETLTFLDKTRQQATQTAGREMAIQTIKVEAWEKVIDMSHRRAIVARTKVRELKGETRKIQKELEKEQRAYHELSRAMPANVYENRVYITAAADKQVKGELALHYNVSGASWEPSYRATANLTEKMITLDIFGTVNQSSGEDWKDVKLSLSTARPDIGTDVPVLKPWYIQTELPQKSKAVLRKKMQQMEQLAQVQKGIVELEEGYTPPPTRITAAGASTVFTAEARAKIPGDGYRHRIPVRTITTPITTEHVAIPKVLTHAFIRAKATNRAPFPLLPGVVEVVVGDSYIGRGMMKLTSPGEPMILSLGIDEKIKIEYKLLRDKVERKRRGDRVATTNVFHISARNYKNEPVFLTVIDQIPVSSSGQVKVTYGREASRALRGAEFPGQLQWLAEIAPGKESAIEFDFTIEYPRALKQRLRSGNRFLKYSVNKIREVQRAKGVNEYNSENDDVDSVQMLEW